MCVRVCEREIYKERDKKTNWGNHIGGGSFDDKIGSKTNGKETLDFSRIAKTVMQKKWSNFEPKRNPHNQNPVKSKWSKKNRS